jgi:hypothetical protein
MNIFYRIIDDRFNIIIEEINGIINTINERLQPKKDTKSQPKKDTKSQPKKNSVQKLGLSNVYNSGGKVGQGPNSTKSHLGPDFVPTSRK